MQKFVDGELNPNISEFSTIMSNMSNFDILLEVYQNKVDDLETGKLPENDLSFIPDSI